MAVTISLALKLGPVLAMCKLIQTHFVWLIQQQGYQHAVHINLCLVIYEDLTLLWTYNCSPCSKCSILFCEMAAVVVMELLVSKVLHAVQYWVTKADGYIQSIQWAAFGMALLQQTAVSFSPTSQPTSAQRGKGLINWAYNCRPATLDTVAQSEDSIQSCDTLLPSTPI